MLHSLTKQAFQLSILSGYQALTCSFSVHEYRGTSQNYLGYRRPKYKPVFLLGLDKALSDILIVLLSRLLITCLSSPMKVLNLKTLSAVKLLWDRRVKRKKCNNL